MKNSVAYVAICSVVLIYFCWAGAQAPASWVQPSFLASMNCWRGFVQFDNQAASRHKYSSLAIKYYDDFWATGVSFAAEPLIPKIIHQIWLGSPLPEKYKKFQRSWKLYHPDWIYMLWTEKEIEKFGLTNKKVYDAAKNPGQKSDIARYEILYRIGGLYVDTDFECLKPFDILHYSLEFYTSCLPVVEAELGKFLLNGLIAARPGHPILKACVDGLNDLSVFSRGDILAQTGPHYFTGVVFETLSSLCGRAVVFPASFFYPLPNFYARNHISQDEARKRFVRDESFAIHWWACSWQK